MTEANLADLSFLFIVFYTSLLLALIFVPFSKKIALALGVVDHPSARKVHGSPLPRMGGLGIAFAFLLTVLLCIKTSSLTNGFLLGAGIIVLTGLLDDLYSIPPNLKFAGEIMAAVVFIEVAGVRLSGFGNLLGFGEIGLGPLATPVTVFCMVGVMNALNLSDGLDGLAGGLSAVALFFLGMLAYMQQSWFLLALILACFGAVLGFLRHNSYPAKLFMGDVGSLFLGFTLGAITVGLADGTGAAPVRPIVMAVILALPIGDTLWVMGNRVRQGLNPFLPDKTHLHHRLMRLGLRHGNVVTVIYVLMFSLGALGLMGNIWPEWLLFGTALALLFGFYAGIGWCERFRVDVGRLLVRRMNQSSRNGLLWQKLTRFTGRYSRVSFRLFLLFFLAPVLLVGPPSRLIGFFALAAVLFIVLLYPWRGGKKEMPMAHGIFFVATVLMVLLYWLNPNQPAWMFAYINGLSLFALMWSLPRLHNARRDTLLPTSFEMMLIALVFFVPLVLAPALGLDGGRQMKIAWSCVQAVPIVILFKYSVRRHARRNRFVVLSFLVTLSFIGVASFLV